ncbi:hypothetical protein KIN20_009066 [Parelaphostrongylus tenuis]|uniref:Uncharacterized protein n=1 Tax=Parelaphostrongylus tenuis TaxID=148309 RepID=A0AAD5M5R2_PARTN|nr:hypothetical protein KIN20_009066 [Parelaphostrongylus tenuis]
MDERLSMSPADERGSASDESFVTARSEMTINRSSDSAMDVDSFLSARSVLSRSTDDENSPGGSSKASHFDETITENIQAHIEELAREKRKIIGLARATVFGSSSSENKNESVPKNGPKLVDLDFSQPSTKAETPTFQRFSSNSDSSDDDEMMDRRKNLTESGKLLKKQLKKVGEAREVLKEVSTSSMMVKKKPKETVLTGVAPKKEYVPAAVFDNFFRLRIRNPKISSSTFDCYLDGHRRVRISELRTEYCCTRR